MTTGFMYCCDPLRPTKVDEHYAREAAVARSIGADVVLLDHDALLAGDVRAAIRRVPPGAGRLWYRGWMMPSDTYERLSQALVDRGCDLAQSPAMYRRAHELPGWYDTFGAVTPKSVWLPSAPRHTPGSDELARLVEPLGGGSAVVKDYVKSRKHEWAEACFVPELLDTEHLHRVVARFVELQDDFLAGGVVVRSFESFTDEGEARVWWVDREPVVVGPHPDTPDLSPAPDLSPVRSLVAALGCRFVTTDMVRRTDGQWRVVEVGDGQVSDLPATVDPTELIGALGRAA